VRHGLCVVCVCVSCVCVSCTGQAAVDDLARLLGGALDEVVLAEENKDLVGVHGPTRHERQRPERYLRATHKIEGNHHVVSYDFAE